MIVTPFFPDNNFYTYEKTKTKNVSVSSPAVESYKMPPSWALRARISFKSDTTASSPYSAEKLMENFIVRDIFSFKEKVSISEWLNIVSAYITDLSKSGKIRLCKVLKTIGDNNISEKSNSRDILITLLKDKEIDKDVLVEGLKTLKEFKNPNDALYGLTYFESPELTKESSGLILLCHKGNDELREMVEKKLSNLMQKYPKASLISVEASQLIEMLQYAKMFKEITSEELVQIIKSTIDEPNMNLEHLYPGINSANPDNIAETFCNAIKTVGSKYKEQLFKEPMIEPVANLKEIVNQFLLINLSDLNNSANINLVLSTLAEIGIPENPKNTEITKIIINKIENIKDGLPALMNKRNDNEIKILVSSLKALETIGLKDKKVSDTLLNILNSSEIKYSKKNIEIQMNLLRTLATVGKDDPDVTNGLLSFIQKIFDSSAYDVVNSPTNDIRTAYSKLQLQSIESLFFADKGKFDELFDALKNNISDIPLESFNAKTMIAIGKSENNEEKNRFFRNVQRSNLKSFSETNRIHHMKKLILSNIDQKGITNALEIVGNASIKSDQMQAINSLCRKTVSKVKI